MTSAALLKANGGKGHLSHGGGGGGGRIALWRQISETQRHLLLNGATAPGLIVTPAPFSGFAGTPQVDFGVGYVGGAQVATRGTVRFVDGRTQATLIMIR